MNKSTFICGSAIATLLASSISIAGGNHDDGIHADSTAGIDSSFDIVHAKISTKGDIATFHMSVAGKAGLSKPAATGELAGSDVYSYVWPTTLNSSTVGFDDNAGILALAVTSHPDFDDTPLYDENGDNKLDNDGNIWHSHWVVLQPNEACGPGALGVVDIPEGATPNVPQTWPGLPILLDSPGWDPIFEGANIDVNVAFADIGAVEAATFDGVTAGLRVNQNLHSPLLCVVDVSDIASGNLSLPGVVNQ